MERPLVGQIADVGFEKRHPAGRIDGLENERRARRERRVGGAQKTQQIGRREVLDDLNGHQAADAGFGLTRKKRDRVGLLHVESSRPAQLHHRVVRVDAARRDASFTQRIEHLAPAAADVDHVGAGAENRQIVFDARPDIFLGASESIFEADIGHRRHRIRKLPLLPRLRSPDWWEPVVSRRRGSASDRSHGVTAKRRCSTKVRCCASSCAPSRRSLLSTYAVMVIRYCTSRDSNRTNPSRA